MSQESLQQFLQQLNSDEALQNRLVEDPDGVVRGFSLTGAEVAALATGDEDGLRRLLGAETEGFGYSLYGAVYIQRVNWSLYFADTNGGLTHNIKPQCFTGPC